MSRISVTCSVGHRTHPEAAPPGSLNSDKLCLNFVYTGCEIHGLLPMMRAYRVGSPSGRLLGLFLHVVGVLHTLNVCILQYNNACSALCRCYSEASDAFSFGVVLYEMFARNPPWDGHENLDVAFRVCSGERMTVSGRSIYFPMKMITE